VRHHNHFFEGALNWTTRTTGFYLPPSILGTPARVLLTGSQLAETSDQKQKPLPLPLDEFLSRFLLHLLIVRICHGGPLFLRFLIFSALLISCVARAQSPASDKATRPAILGSLEKGECKPSKWHAGRVDTSCYSFAPSTRRTTP